MQIEHVYFHQPENPPLELTEYTPDEPLIKLRAIILMSWREYRDLMFPLKEEEKEHATG